MSSGPLNHDMSFLWDEEATEEDEIKGYQHLIDTGMAWRLEGHVGRTAMSMIEEGLCMLGEEPHFDYYGSRVPSRTEVLAGTKGSREFVAERHPEVLIEPDPPAKVD